MHKINVIIIGLGSIGKRHLAILDAQPLYNIVGVFDIDPSLYTDLKKLYPNLRYLNTWSEVLSVPNCDLAIICTPHHLHAPLAIECLQHNRHVLVEKPMCLTVHDAQNMIQAAQKNHTLLFVVKQNRYNIPVKLAKEALMLGKLGKIYMVKCDILWNRHAQYYLESPWRGKKATEGGALYTQGSHFIDLLIHFFGVPVSAKTIVHTQNHNIEIEDCGSSIVSFPENIICALNWTNNVYHKNYEGSITIIGEKGTIKVGGQYLNKMEYWDVESYPLQEGIDFTDRPNLYGKYQGTSSNHDQVLNDVAQAIHNNNYNSEIVNGEEALKTVQAIDLIYKAI